MSRATVARAKHPRAQKTAEAMRAKLAHLAFKMEQPLDDAIDYVQALSLMGYGMMGSVAEGDERAIVTVAGAASKRLDDLKDSWRGMITFVRPRPPNTKQTTKAV